jgi:hypothetical protein
MEVIMALSYTRHEKITLKNNPTFNEKWLQGIISEDPSILGLGDLDVKEVEKPLTYGRLDLLLKDDESNTRYEVEIQLGKVDESHIIRTIEYWDEERNRYPQYDHIAVIIAEDITNRFLNVISLFNKAIPIIAIQMNTMKIDEKVILNFTKVLDYVQRADDEEDTDYEPSDRNYWNKRSSEATLKAVDLCFEYLKSINSSFSLNYNKGYIGIKDQYKSNNMVIFWPKHDFLRVGSKNEDKSVWFDKLEAIGTYVFREKKTNRVQFRTNYEDLKKNKDLFIELFRDAYKENQEE